MKSLNVRNMGGAAKQAGFTIIELVVVILLLGILTATALPRFLDISDEAHEAVVNAHLGSLSTAAALYRAAWFANQQRTNTSIDYDGTGPGVALWPSTTGYPVGIAGGLPAVRNFVQSHADCAAIFTNLMQTGGTSLSATALTGAAGTAFGIGTVLTAGVAPTTEWAAQWIDLATTTTPDAPDGCSFYYLGQFSNTGDTPRVINYVPVAGTIAVATSTALADEL
jgi:MSHA pilin protein MshB